MKCVVVDIATSPLANAKDFIDDDFTAPSNYGEEAAAKFVEKKRAEATTTCALDPDLCRISGIGFAGEGVTGLCQTMTAHHYGNDAEALMLKEVLFYLDKGYRLVSFNGLKFDWPVLNARSRYLGVLMSINLDRFKSPHVDLYAKLTNHGQLKGHSLGWWVRRLGWTDLQKPLSGAEEARVPETGQWDDLAASLRHDVTATYRLAQWLGVIPKAQFVETEAAHA